MPILNWLTRDDDIQTARVVPYRLLEEVTEYSSGDPDAENMLIQGDNLDALKALLPYYSGRVKCIYADPPFNTGQAFPDYDDNVEHSLWLSMIYPSLELQRDLLAEDGTLFIHIDDNELGYLIAITDEIMGRKNRVAIVTFKQGAATGHKAINPGMVSIVNFLLIYAKNKEKWKPNRLFTMRERDKRYGKFLKNPDSHYTEWEFGTLSKAITEHTGKGINKLKKELGVGYEEFVNDFVINHAKQVAQFVRPDYEKVSDEARIMIDASLSKPQEIMLLEREKYSDLYFIGGQRIIFYSGKLKEVDGELVSGEPLTTLWDDLLSNNLHKEGGVELPKSKKPEALVKRCLELSTKEDDLVLDCYLGSGTTAAAAHKMKRKWIGIERGEHAQTKCLPRLKSVVDGEQSGISKTQLWKGGGGYHFFKLGEPVFDEEGYINPNISFSTLASHIWFSETGHALSGKPKAPFLGIHEGTAYVLLYNGILGDKKVNGGNVLTHGTIKLLKGYTSDFNGPWVIYGEWSPITEEVLRGLQITFKQTPYDIRTL
jgi:adenine-specific DNA-methyltransferase